MPDDIGKGLAGLFTGFSGTFPTAYAAKQKQIEDQNAAQLKADAEEFKNLININALYGTEAIPEGKRKGLPTVKGLKSEQIEAGTAIQKSKEDKTNNDVVNFYIKTGTPETTMLPGPLADKFIERGLGEKNPEGTVTIRAIKGLTEQKQEYFKDTQKDINSIKTMEDYNKISDNIASKMKNNIDKFQLSANGLTLIGTIAKLDTVGKIDAAISAALPSLTPNDNAAIPLLANDFKALLSINAKLSIGGAKKVLPQQKKTTEQPVVKSPYKEYPDAFQEDGVWKVLKNGKKYRIE